MASVLADSIKPQVLMMMMSASAGSRHGGVAVLDEGVAEYVGVDLVLRAAEGDNGNFHWVVL